MCTELVRVITTYTTVKLKPQHHSYESNVPLYCYITMTLGWTGLCKVLNLQKYTAAINYDGKITLLPKLRWTPI